MGDEKKLYTDVDEESSLFDSFEDYKEDMGIEHRTTAVHELLEHGLTHAGYNGKRAEEQTALLRATRAGVIISLLLGMAWALGGLYAGSRPLSAGGVAVLLVSVFFFTLHSGLERVEPKASARICEWFNNNIHPSRVFSTSAEEVEE